MIGTITAKGLDTPLQRHQLKIGINRIGRLSDDSQQAAADEVLLNTSDSSIHRQYHCVIEVVLKKDDYNYILSPYQTASNATCIGHDRTELHLLDQVYLKENMPFYIGQETVLMLNLMPTV
jgi:hypothetical protein